MAGRNLNAPEAGDMSACTPTKSSIAAVFVDKFTKTPLQAAGSWTAQSAVQGDEEQVTLMFCVHEPLAALMLITVFAGHAPLYVAVILTLFPWSQPFVPQSTGKALTDSRSHMVRFLSIVVKRFPALSSTVAL